MNYIRHLNTFFSLIKDDNRLSSSHISLYIALFHYWNFNRFNNPFSIYRENIMQLSKLSKNTYHKCLKQLHDAKYIYYHPSPSKFQAVRISIVRLDKEEEQPSQYKQLEMFSPKIETGSVANLSLTSPNSKTDTVTDLRHIYKPNSKKENSVLHTPTEIFKRNKKLNQKINELDAVSNSIPTVNEVEAFFQQNKYPVDEAKKFFLYNEGKNWMLTDKMPITNWQSLAHKWMLNTSITPKQVVTKSDHLEVQYLYDSFLEGKDIFKYITAQHFHELKLELKDEIIPQAWQERINQLIGSNQQAAIELWKAYLAGGQNNELVIRDKPNLVALSKRIAVIKHFQKLKTESK